jgi:ATP/maltotriose-dependent transcriptional regulator MalT
MDTSFASALSAQSLRASLSAVSYESGIAPANNAQDSDGMQHSGASLSMRERAIVLLMGHGLTNKMIARQLSIAPETVKSHAKRIFLKLTVQTRAQAVYRASALGLI